MNKLSLKIKETVSKGNKLSVLFYKLLNIYRKMRFFKYKYYYAADENLILFNVGNDFTGTIRELYETMLNDEKYIGFQFILSVVDVDKDELKDSSTVKIARNSRRFLKLFSKAKYYFTDVIDLHLSQKKEQVYIYVDNNNSHDINNKLEEYINKKQNKFINNKVDYIIDNEKKLNTEEITDLCKKIILSKTNVKLTLTYALYKRKIIIPFRDKKIQIKGFFREHFFQFSKNSKKLKAYKNKYKGKRCFLVGNGPSLTAQDLDMIKDEISFGCNLITKIYDKTQWRPTFHCLADALYAKHNGEELINELCSDVFALSTAYKHLSKYDFKYDMISIDFISNKPSRKYKVKMPIAYSFPAGTVMSLMLCLALYMGFDEICLLGVDATSSLSSSGHFIKGYMNDSVKRADMKRVAKKLKKSFITEEEVAKYYYDRVINAYGIIEEYAKKKNVKIYNCTRGGALEVYERKKLEDVLREV